METEVEDEQSHGAPSLGNDRERCVPAVQMILRAQLISSE